MSFVAVLNSRISLQALLQGNNRPLAVASRSRAVADQARELGIPVVHCDDLYAAAERSALQDHVDDLTRALAGDKVPSGAVYPDWAWWALEFPLSVSLSHGARTRRMLAAVLELAPGADAVVHDGEDWVQGALINLDARSRGLTSLGLAHQGIDAVHLVQDLAVAPIASEGARVHWRGRPLSHDARPNVVVFHANEVAQCIQSIEATGGVRLIQDGRDRWPYPGPTLEADPVGPEVELVPAVWPGTPGVTTEAWEREIAELLFVTWQPFLRETLSWTEAAYGAGKVRAVLAAQDYIPHMRCRILASHRLGIPTILVQHGAFLSLRPGGRGNRNHYFADHSLVWSRETARDLERWGLKRPTHVIGWPQAASDQARAEVARRAQAPADPSRPWVILASGTGSDTAEVPYEMGEVFLRDALSAVRAFAPEAPIVLKGHPFHDKADRLKAFCAGLGIGNVTIVVDTADMWALAGTARGIVGTTSTSTLCALALGVPVVVYYPAAESPWYDRFAGVPVARTREQLEHALRGTQPISGTQRWEAMFRSDISPVRRIAAILRRAIGGSSPRGESRPAHRRIKASAPTGTPGVRKPKQLQLSAAMPILGAEA